MRIRSSAWPTRWAALSAVSVAVACARPALPDRPAGEPELRVGLVTRAAAVTVGAEGQTVTVRADGPQEVRRFASPDQRRPVTVDGKGYRGAVEVSVRDGAVTVVNVVRVEDYVRGVVAAELGAAVREPAALQAQAMLSRTYALKNRGRFRAEGYDVAAGVSDQVYAGVAAENPAVDAAVRATAGRVLTWRGELIAPFFHSTCGSSTAAPDEAFRSVRDLPYLRPVSDRHGDGYYCDISPRFRWRVEWDAGQLRDILRRTVPEVLGVAADEVTAIRDVYVRRTGGSGRALELRLAVEGGEIPVFGPDVRRVLAGPDGAALGSNAFRLESEHRDGVLDRLTAVGAGWGHGVGMCQWGAVGRARAGQDAETILTTYFPGTSIARWY